MEDSMRSQREADWTIRGRGPGFVVWLSARGARVAGFITWAETGVAELSPAMRDAWHFPTVTAANSAAERAFGPAIEGCAMAVFPVRL
jgi:hypothetical protein